MPARASITKYSKPKLLVLAIAGGALIPTVVLFPWKKPPRPIVDNSRLAPDVTMQDVTFYSAALKRVMAYRIFMPANVGRQKLAVVYLLHGGDGSFRDWSNYTDVARLGSGLLLVR